MPLSRPSMLPVPHRARRVIAAVATLATFVSTTGCFTYRTVNIGELQPEMTVHMQLTATAVDRLRNAPNGERRLLDGFALDGTVASAADDSVVVSVPTTNATDPSMRAMQFRQPLTLRRGEVEQVQVRTLDRKKTTWMTVTLSVLGLAAAAYAIRRGGEATGSTPVDGGPNEIRVPSFVR